MENISTLREYQYDSLTGEIIVRSGENCECIGYTTLIEAPALVETVFIPRPIDIMITQVYEYSYGDENKPRLILPEKIQYNSDNVIITFAKKLSKIRVNMMFVCGYEHIGIT